MGDGALDLDGAVRQLGEEGYTVLPSLYPAEDVALFRRALIELHEGMDNLPSHPERHGPLPPAVELSPAGLVFHHFAARRPEVVPRLLRPEAVEILRRFLGRDMHLELAAGVVSDETRPFFEWHNHIGGSAERRFRGRPQLPRFERPQRVAVLCYLDDLEPGNGPLWVMPRRVSDPTEPPHATDREDWPGRVEIHCPRGSVVMIEQCTWHAVPQKREPGRRLYVGCYFGSREAPRSSLEIDDALYDHDDPLFRSVLPRREGRADARKAPR